jgi:hypothetical protein
MPKVINRCPLRLLANRSSKKIGALNIGDSVTKIGEEGGWWKVKKGGNQGWVQKKKYRYMSLL